MRCARRAIIMRDREQYFHIVSRVVDRRCIFGDEERGYFLRVMRQMEGFSGLQVLSYSLMGNHFHILVRVPVNPGEMREREVWDRMRHLYSEVKIREYEEWVQEQRDEGMEDRIAEFFKQMRGRMYDLSNFVQAVKQRFSVWYNHRNDRCGTLWEERFRSVLVQGGGEALSRVAAYIELNAVRAGIVTDPKDFRWCSYTEALAGGRLARAGIGLICWGGNGRKEWKALHMEYRAKFQGNNERGSPEQGAGRPDRGRDSKQSGLVAGSELPWASELMVRARYYTVGLVLGTEAFIADFHQRQRKFLSGNRKRISVPMKGEPGGGLHTYRDVRE